MATVFKPRSAWTSQARGGASLAIGPVLGIVYHWPGTTLDRYGVESEAAVASHIRGWYNYHVNVRGWVDIGYNFAIDLAGRVWDLRGSSRVGAHCASASNQNANHEWIGVLLILGDREEPSAAMLQACRDFRNQVFIPKFNETRVTGHNRIPGASTTCCGPYAFEAIDGGKMVGGSTPPVPPKPPQKKEIEMFISPYGSTRARLVTGDRMVGIAKTTFDKMAKAGITVVNLTNAEIESLQAQLVFEGDVE